jgi:uncharacterized phage-associated protein
MIIIACKLSCFDIAKYFLAQVEEELGDSISNLKLQKLAYYAQGFHLAMFEGIPLFDEKIEAWTHGPVIPDLYDLYKDYESGPIPLPKDLDLSVYSDEARKLLDEVYSVYGQFSAWKLRDLTHDEKPWLDAYRSAPGSEISLKSMQDFFETQVDSDS